MALAISSKVSLELKNIMCKNLHNQCDLCEISNAKL